jgi:hypothetical protein
MTTWRRGVPARPQQFLYQEEDYTMDDPFARSGPPHQATPTTASNPYANNATAVPSDLTPLVPKVPAPPQLGVDALQAVKDALKAGVQPPR